MPALNLTDAEKPALVIDFADGALFGNDAGEDELPEVLDSYFVDQPAFKAFLSQDKPLEIARSRKGMGKSALLSKLAFDLEKDATSPIVIKTTGEKLIGILEPNYKSYLQCQGYWSRVICARINYEVGKTVGFAFSENAMALVESSEMAGFRERSIVGALLQRVKSSKIPVEITIKEYGNHEELLRRALQTYSDRKVWLLVDDIDSTYIDTPEQQMLISTFFSACRSLVREFKGLNIRASVRSDVWSNFRDNEDLDKCEQYVTDISWSAGDLQTILSKKIYSYFERNFSKEAAPLRLDYRHNADALLDYAFASRMRWGSSMVPPFRPIRILSAGRPRWMSQLCRLAGVEANRNAKPRIGIAEISGVMKRYSRLRLNDIYKEHSHQFAGLEKLIEAFSNAPARYDTNELLSQIARGYVNSVGAGSIGEIDGVPYRRHLQLAHFLYRIGFIVGRKEQEGVYPNADFVRFEERPELLTETALDDGLLWEVHPSYRDALSIGLKKREAVRQSREPAPSRQAVQKLAPEENTIASSGTPAKGSRRSRRRGRKSEG